MENEKSAHPQIRHYSEAPFIAKYGRCKGICQIRPFVQTTGIRRNIELQSLTTASC
jgi:hypothetical protein